MEEHLEIDVFWSFRSPWSYLATPRLAEWQRRYVLRVNFRPVYPIAVRTPEFFDHVHPLWRNYFLLDVHRVAELLEIPFRWARPDPVAQVVVQVPQGERLVTAPQQPYIHRLTRLGALAAERGDGIAFAEQVSGLIWGGQEAWNEGEHLAQAAARAGFDLAELDPIVVAEPERLDAVIESNQRALEQAGHWGVPTCAFRGEPFFGQDRLDVLLWRLEQHGLRER
jgi:2-hydroxychromene-2-carboxylate isomerase